MPSIPHAIYFWFSLIFLIARTLAVSLYSAEIYDQSKKPIQVLRAVPNNSWRPEVRRFTEQVVNDTIAFTGMRFFYITRKLILAVCDKLFCIPLAFGDFILNIGFFQFQITGTIITYELVLVQFQTDAYSQLCPKGW